MPSIKKLKIWLNLLLLISAALTIIFFWALYLTDDFPEKLEAAVVQHYIEDKTQDFDLARQSLLSGDPTPAIKLLKRWETSGRSDRMYHHKRTLFFLLADYYYQTDNIAQLHQMTQVWLEQDPRDASVLAYNSEALRKTAGNEETGFQLLEKYWNHFPSNVPLTRFYRNALLEKNDQETLLRLFTTKLNRELDAWRVFWDDGSGFSAEHSADLILTRSASGGSYSAFMEVPVSTQILRIDPPPYSILLISNIFIGPVHSLSEFDLNAVALHQIEKAGSFLETTATEDPYFHFPLTLADDGSNTDTVNLGLTLNLSVPKADQETATLTKDLITYQFDGAQGSVPWNNGATLNTLISRVPEFGAGEIILPEGTLELASKIEIKALNNLILRGKNTTLVFSSAVPTDNSFIEIKNCSNLHITGMTFAGETPAHGIRIHNSKQESESESPASKISIDNCRFSGFTGTGISVEGRNNLSIKNCQFEDLNGVAIELGSNSRGMIEKNTITRSQSGIRITNGSNTVIRNNEISDVTTAIQLVDSEKPASSFSDLDIYNNNLSFDLNGLSLTDSYDGLRIFENLFNRETGAITGDNRKTSYVANNHFRIKSSLSEMTWEAFWNRRNASVYEFENAPVRVEVTQGDAIEAVAQLVLPNDVFQLRIDPTRDILFSMSGLTLTIHGERYEIPVERMVLERMIREGSGIKPSGENDPFFYFEIPQFKNPGDELVNAELSFQIQ